MESLPVVGYAVSAYHAYKGDTAQAKQAAARCTNSTVATGVTLGAVVAAPFTCGASLVAVAALAGAGGVAAGNGVQAAIETTYTDSDRKQVGQEAQEKDLKAWAIDVAVGGAVGAAGGALEGLAASASRAVVGESQKAAGAATTIMGRAVYGDTGRYVAKRSVEQAVKKPVEKAAGFSVRKAGEALLPSKRAVRTAAVAGGAAAAAAGVGGDDQGRVYLFVEEAVHLEGPEEAEELEEWGSWRGVAALDAAAEFRKGLDEGSCLVCANGDPAKLLQLDLVEEEEREGEDAGFLLRVAHNCDEDGRGQIDGWCVPLPRPKRMRIVLRVSFSGRRFLPCEVAETGIAGVFDSPPRVP